MSTLAATTKSFARWNLGPSLGLELLKVAHQISYFCCVTSEVFATVGCAFSLIYLMVYFAGLEGANSLVPYLRPITANSQPLRYLLRKLIIPQFFLYSLAASIFLLHPLAIVAPLTPLLMLITISEGVRSNLRTILHHLHGPRVVTLVDLPPTLLYFAYVWAGYYAGLHLLTPQNLLLPYAATSILATIALLVLLILRPIQRSTQSPQKLPSGLDIINTRITLSLLRFPQTILSANLLVPIFVATMGTTFTAAAKIASDIATAVQALIKASVGRSLSTILTMHPEQQAHQVTFPLLWQQLIEISLCAAIITTSLTSHLIATQLNVGWLIIAFFLSTILDYIFIIYEPLFILNHRTKNIMLLRVAEAIAGSMLIYTWPQQPFVIISAIVALKAITLCTAARMARKTWQVGPHANIRPKVIMVALMLGGALSLALNIYKQQLVRVEQCVAARR